MSSNQPIEKKPSTSLFQAGAKSAVADYSAYAETPATDKLAQLAELANQQSKLEAEISAAEEALEKKREDLKQLSEQTLPVIMDSLGMQEFTTLTGLKITIKEDVRANLAKTRLAQGIKWLDDNGFAHLVKRKFIISFGKKDEELAKAFKKELEERKTKLDIEDESGVHAKTLSSFVKEQLEAGKDIPMELFGVFRQRVAKIEVKK